MIHGFSHAYRERVFPPYDKAYQVVCLHTGYLVQRSNAVQVGLEESWGMNAA